MYRPMMDHLLKWSIIKKFLICWLLNHMVHSECRIVFNNYLYDWVWKKMIDMICSPSIINIRWKIQVFVFLAQSFMLEPFGIRIYVVQSVLRYPQNFTSSLYWYLPIFNVNLRVFFIEYKDMYIYTIYANGLVCCSLRRFQRKARFIQWMKGMPRIGMALLPRTYEFSNVIMFSSTKVQIWQCCNPFFYFSYVEKCKFPTDGSPAKSLRYIGRYYRFLTLEWV
jgi:hypothetical protein